MNRNTTIALSIVFGGLLLYYLLVQAPKDKAAATSSATPFGGQETSYVWQTTSDQVSGVRLEDRVNHRSVAFAKDASGGGWVVTEPEASPADPGAVGLATSSLASMPVNATITETTDLGAFGLIGAQYSLEFTLADGQKMKAAIGDKTPTGSGYYLQREGDSQVLVVASYGLDSIIALLKKPPYQPTATPVVTETAATATAGGLPEPATPTP